MKRAVIKIGSNVLTRTDGTLDVTRMTSIVEQIAGLCKSGVEVIMVTSGAVACGKAILGHGEDLDSVAQRQLFSAVGQVELMRRYSSLFGDFGMKVGQVLIMKENFTRADEYEHLHCCMETMLERKVLPILNENDTVCVTELMFTDNDELSGITAEMMNADTLILLSDVDGLYNGDPASEGTSLLNHVSPDDDISHFISSRKSAVGRGGMASKCRTAMGIAAKGVKVIVANGKRNGIITALADTPQTVPHTEFSIR